MGDIGALYAAGRQRVGDLVIDLDDGQAKTPVPGCPEWSVADVVAHLAGVCADILSGNLEGLTTPPWTAAQVEARRGRTVAELVEEWSQVGPQCEAIAAHFPGRSGWQWLFDQTTHEQDVRGALGRPGARDSENVQMGLEFLVGGLAASVKARGLPPLEVRTDEGASWVVGGGDPFEGSVEEALRAALMEQADFTGGEAAASVQGSAFELLRAFGGRRSVEQVRALDWSDDPGTWLPALTFGPFTPSPAPVEE